ncbi:MAG: HAMP domain-containing protein [Gammaproteobacteria bacterium]|nr:MAG: HAMP domain-containing protein [Gammaproteobacteria bacterium]
MLSIRNSITYKLFIYIFSIFIVLLVSFAYVNYYLTRARLYSRLELQTETLSEGLSHAVEGFLASNNMYAIQRLLGNLAASKEVISISVINRDHIILADSDPKYIGQRVDDPLIIEVLKKEKNMIRYIDTSDNKKVLLLIRPLYGNLYSSLLRSAVVGVVYVKMSTESINEKINQDFLFNLLLIIMATIGVVVYTVVVSRKLLINPIKMIEHYARLIANGNFDVKIPKMSNDEFGDLAKHLNEMTEKIIAAKQAIQLSRQAGMAEIATGILHNVGNVLNSINVSASLLKKRLTESPLGRLQDVSQLMQEHNADIGTYLTTDPKGKHLPSYLKELANYWQEECQYSLEEYTTLLKNIEHIKEVISMQQSLAGSGVAMESLNLAEVVDDAIKISMIDSYSSDIKIIKEYDGVETIYTDKNKILQIIINLIKNAKEALSSSQEGEKCILVRIKPADGNTVKIQVSDNGMGIMPDHLANIFSYGYTTKKTGHGFGLHSCLFTAKELNGNLEVASEGLNKGATFTLIIPLGSKS